ncbi:hypothetical protein B0H10DRAFT_1998248 [Mycena sp. CBHHK59/15]|nr:hypothetical protein B0H10DRAFT_1998248 [Mycena sp. CBHHK59/15]
MSSIHLRRAKLWRTNEFNAEWIHNGVEYCRKDPEGKVDFEAWLVDEYGVEGARTKLHSFQSPARMRSSMPPEEGNVWWEQAAVTLCLTVEALRTYTNYVNMHDVAAPLRVKPALKRKRGEGSIEWQARRHQAHLAGHKIPEMDWHTARAIAVSEFDRVRDTWEVWHTSPQVFFDAIVQRGKTVILGPDILANPDKDFVRLHKIDDGFRGRVYSLTLAHMVWLEASELMQDLFRMGLTTSAAIEREYKEDRGLMLRLISCFTKVHGLSLHLWSNMTQVVAGSDNIAPYVKRWRTEDGKPHIEVDKDAVAKGGLDMFEINIIWIITQHTRLVPTFCDLLTDSLAADPHVADKFNSAALDIFGEVAVVHEFVMQMEASTFGRNLMRRARSLAGTERDLWAAMSAMDRPKVWKMPSANCDLSWGRPYAAMRAIRDAWLEVAWRLNMQGAYNLLGELEKGNYLGPAQFDVMWETYDYVLWERSRPQFGLYDVDDPTRPTCTGFLLRELMERLLVTERDPVRNAGSVTTAPPVYITPSQTVAQSGHAYLATAAPAPKDKSKTRKSSGVVHTATPGVETVATGGLDEDADEEFPELLPSGYKLGKKVTKVFHRILEEDDTPAGQGESTQKKGQIRWDVFERAMRRIGFGVCQTAGSSVRFDPPATKAHPITFHRPHPDPILTPQMIRWIGARLKRNYGWTLGSFTQGEDAD